MGAFSTSGDPETHETFGKMAKLMPKVMTPFSYRLPDNHDIDSYARECATNLEETILNEGPLIQYRFLEVRCAFARITVNVMVIW